MIALSLVVLALLMVARFGEPLRVPWMIAFLLLLAFQFAIIWVRYGFGTEAIILIQPLFSVLIAPLAFLSFANPVLAYSSQNAGGRFYTKLNFTREFRR